jgi:hypothetical protein
LYEFTRGNSSGKMPFSYSPPWEPHILLFKYCTYFLNFFLIIYPVQVKVMSHFPDFLLQAIYRSC